MYKTKAKCFTKMLILSFFVFRSQGLLAAIPLSYILPGLIFIKLDPHSLFSREKFPAIALVIFGLIVSISGRFCCLVIAFGFGIQQHVDSLFFILGACQDSLWALVTCLKVIRIARLESLWATARTTIFRSMLRPQVPRRRDCRCPNSGLKFRKPTKKTFTIHTQNELRNKALFPIMELNCKPLTSTHNF